MPDDNGHGRDPDDEPTVVERHAMPSAVNPANRGKLAVLSDLTIAMLGRVQRLGEICHSIAVEPALIHDATWGRVADLLQEDGEQEIKAAASLR